MAKRNMHIKLSTSLDAPASEIFALLHDYSRRASWDTFVPHAVLLNADSAGRGVIVRCTDRFGLCMETVYVGYRPPHLATIRMTKGPIVFRQLAGSWRLVAVSEQRCRLDITYNLKTSPRWARPVLEPLVCYLFWLQTRRRLRALVRYVQEDYAATPP
jgi:ribosome-associated toxin RatA of RatAB toxin-antitoxin module